MDINSIKGTGLTSQSSREKLIHELKGLGIKNPEVLNLISNMPRHLFLDTALANRAYENVSLPIGFKQTISQPYMVAKMTELLHETNSMNHVLEIGTGSGYQAAVLSHICRRVFTVERFETLLRSAQLKFKSCNIHNIVTKHGDGYLGWPEQAPFDRIIVTAASKSIPEELTSQLREGGLMIIPLEDEGKKQKIFSIKKTKNNYDKYPLVSVKFVPLIQGKT